MMTTTMFVTAMMTMTMTTTTMMMMMIMMMVTMTMTMMMIMIMIMIMMMTMITMRMKADGTAQNFVLVQGSRFPPHARGVPLGGRAPSGAGSLSRHGLQHSQRQIK